MAILVSRRFSTNMLEIATKIGRLYPAFWDSEVTLFRKATTASLQYNIDIQLFFQSSFESISNQKGCRSQKI